MTKSGGKILVSNRRARFDYAIEDTYDAGIVLVGSEVKSLRAANASLVDAYAEIRQGEAWLVNAMIKEYAWSNQNNHEPRRTRKLLLHKQEIKKIAVKTEQRGYTLVPMSFFLQQGKIKVRLGLGTGKRSFEKRESKKEAEAKREMDRAIKQHRTS